MNQANKLLEKMCDQISEVKDVGVFANKAIGFGYEFSFLKTELIITKTGLGEASKFELHVKAPCGGGQESFQSMPISQSHQILAEKFIQRLERPLLIELSNTRKFSF